MTGSARTPSATIAKNPASSGVLPPLSPVSIHLNLVLLGPPGAGKGTQAARVAGVRGVPRLSTGDVLREAARIDSQRGRHLQSVMGRGELVEDAVVTDIVRARIERADASRGFVLDGFPRTHAQAEALDAMMSSRGPLIIIDIEVPEMELARRLGARLTCEACGATTPDSVGQSTCTACSGRLAQRADDQPAVVAERLKVYRKEIAPLSDFYRARPTFRSVCGAQSAALVSLDMAAAIEAALASALAGPSLIVAV